MPKPVHVPTPAEVEADAKEARMRKSVGKFLMNSLMIILFGIMFLFLMAAIFSYKPNPNPEPGEPWLPAQFHGTF